jgi:hypothetical protein
MMDSTEVERRGAVRTDETIDAIELYYVQSWTDGLPVVPPTRADVGTIPTFGAATPH